MEPSMLLQLKHGSLYMNLKKQLEFIDLFAKCQFDLSPSSVVDLYRLCKEDINNDYIVASKQDGDEDKVEYISNYCIDEDTFGCLKLTIMNMFGNVYVHMKKFDCNQCFVNSFLIEGNELPAVMLFFEKIID